MNQTTETLTPTQAAIAKSFKDKITWKQYLYATQGFTETAEGRVHSQRGRDFYDFFKSLDGIVFNIANGMLECGEEFDRDEFLEACGMQRSSAEAKSFVPTIEFIRHCRHEEGAR